MPTYRFITCNARLQTPHDGEQQFFNRVDFLCETLLSFEPDIIGFQEVKPEMRKALIARMPGYGFLGGGRDSARLDESSLIVFKQDRFMVERLISDILSPTPHLPGTTYGGDQSHCPRVFSSADFMPLEGGQPFRFMNIHTDHEGAEARRLAMTQLLRSYKELQVLRPMPTVITGDFNARPDAPEMEVMTNSCFTDATAHIGGTYHDFDREKEPWKIDYIWLTEEWQAGKVTALHPKKGDLFFSDHDPIVADVTL